ncbi:response regulator transcription factor [Streptomyces sp. SID12501]|uniref:Response regulator transcription factor n=1 Tax=Streptomyces sp. SID12501 TaxID=2706042 RepID=A0A6B3C3T5_9ACTN|nr:response regulator transcription factor [Streptomyces sp. SID12501]NEC91066.1 response regulator transcription factor [Streptomyces sp. SID12501]
MPTVLIVDDQFLIRSGLNALLRAAPGIEVVGEAQNGEEAIEMAARTRPDVILMDIRMPGTSGIIATERILAQASAPLPKILVLTTFDLDEYVYGALKVGACGFLLKDTPPDRLLAAIDTVHAGDMLFSAPVIKSLIEACTPRPAAPEPHSGLETLPPRELEVLGLVGSGMSNSDIAQRLVLSTATIKTHVHRCMSKLMLNSRAQAVVFAYETGLTSRSSAAWGTESA